MRGRKGGKRRETNVFCKAVMEQRRFELWLIWDYLLALRNVLVLVSLSSFKP